MIKYFFCISAPIILLLTFLSLAVTLVIMNNVMSHSTQMGKDIESVVSDIEELFRAREVQSKKVDLWKTRVSLVDRLEGHGWRWDTTSPTMEPHEIEDLTRLRETALSYLDAHMHQMEQIDLAIQKAQDVIGSARHTQSEIASYALTHALSQTAKKLPRSEVEVNDYRSVTRVKHVAKAYLEIEAGKRS